MLRRCSSAGAPKLQAERLPVTFQEADAEELPFADGSFDVVLSVFGVMFTPNQEQAAPGTAARLPSGRQDRPGELDAGELHRPCLPHDWQVHSTTCGRQTAGAVGHRAARPRALRRGISELTVDQRFFVFRYRSAEHWLEIFRTYYGPVLKAFAALDAEGQAGLARDLTDLLERFNTGGSETLTVPSEYLEVVATRR